MEPNKLDAFDLELSEAAAQRSQAWRDVRAGKFTASEIFKLLTEPKSKADKEAGNWSQGAMTYIITKVAEELTGQVHQQSNAYPLVYGIDMEPLAKEYFTNLTGKEVSYSGFKIFNPHSGGSPDGFVDNDAIIEIKCPFNSANQIEYLSLKSPADLASGYPEYWWQMQANMIFNNRAKTYFVTYDPRFTADKHKMKILEVPAVPEDQDFMLKKLMKAIEEKLKLIQLLS